MENQRLLLFMALGFITLLLFQAWQADYGPQPVPQQTSEETGVATGESAADIPAASTRVGQTVTGVTANAPAADGASSDTGVRITIDTDVVSAVVDSRGGNIVSLTLDKYPVSIDEPDTPFALMSDAPDNFLIAQSGLQAAEGSVSPTHKAVYQSQATEYVLGDDQAEIVVPLVWEENGVRVTKTLTFSRNSYEIKVDYLIENTGTETWSASQYYQLQRKAVTSDETNQFIRTYTGAVVSTAEETYKKVDFGDIEDSNLSVRNTGGWIAMIQHYFAGAWIPPTDASNTFYTIHLANQNRYIVGMNSDLLSVEPGGTATLTATAYVGPKVQEWLNAAADKLGLTVDYGWLTILAQPLFWLLNKLHSLVGNWGWAIIFLTCIIKLIFYPLSQASYKSMARMKKLQPKLVSLKERYGDDRAKMGQATMELYKKEKVNPLGGCLPMLVQIPVFIALYWMLLESVELRQAPWALWIKDLAIKDPLYIMPVIMGVTMFIQQKLNPAPVDPIQAKVFMVLPLIFTVFFAFFPAGLVLYWIVNNTLSIAQQYYITRHVIGDK